MWHARRSGEVFTGFWLGGPKGRDHWEEEDLGVVGMDLRETGISGVNWIRLAQDTIQRRAYVSTVMNLRVP
jgi:hypothetical protein